MRTMSRIAACVALGVSALCAGCVGAPLKNGLPTVARMERLRPSPLLLEVPDSIPEAVRAEFDVAHEAPRLRWGVLPGQWEGASLWSTWGDALCASDGKYYLSIGDHDSPHGSCFVHSVDPRTRKMALVVDVNEVVGMPRKGYAPGKLHCPIVEATDGKLYFGTFQSAFDDTAPEHGYKGDWMLAYDPDTGACESLGNVVPDSSIVSLRYHAPSNRLNGQAYKGKTMPQPRNRFFSYDLGRRELVFLGGPESEIARAIIQTRDGRVYYDSGGKMVRYDPGPNTAAAIEARLPGNGQLRAASLPDAKGVAYCVSLDGAVFSFDTATEQVTEIGPAFPCGNLYTTVCVLDPSGRYLYYAPGSGGLSAPNGSPVVQMNVRTGRRKVLAFLNDYMRQEKGYNMGGTYSMMLNADAGQLVMCWNGGLLADGAKDFGLCSALVLDIPESERTAE